MPGDPFDLLEAIEDYVARAVAPLQARMLDYQRLLDSQIAARPIPERGADGVNGKDAEVDYDRIGAMLKALVATVPAGLPGERGVDGKAGADGLNGASGRDGVDGKDADPREVSETVSRLAQAIARKFAEANANA